MDADDLEMAASNYLAAGRSIAAIHAFGLDVSQLSAGTIFKILDSAINELNAAREQISNEFVFELEQIFDSLQRREGVPSIEIAKREYAYLALFEYRERHLTL